MVTSPAAAPRLPARTVLASIAGLWTCYFLLATLRGWVVGFDFSAAMLSRRLAVTIAAMAVTALLWLILRLLENRALWLKSAVVLAAALPASLAIAAINQWVFSDIENEVVAKLGEQSGISIRRDEAGNVLVDVPDPPAPPTPPALPDAVGAPAGAAPATLTIDSTIDRETRWRQITDAALGRYFMLIAWAALYLALAYAGQARAAERREGEYRRAAKAAELRSLRYQLNPHFLFNTLNSLSALVMTGKADAAETMIQTLAKFYRHSLAGNPTGDLPLAEEIALQRHYLEIEAVRFPERLRVAFDIAPGLADAQVPGMILQPLVENSVKYGVAMCGRPVTIVIAAAREDGRLVLTVTDDGPGTGDGAGAPGGFGIGLANVRDRLWARFGEDASIDSGPLAQGGYRTQIRLPLISEGGAREHG